MTIRRHTFRPRPWIIGPRGRSHNRADIAHHQASGWAELHRDESGSTLLLALVFVVAIGMALFSLAGSVGNNLLNSTNLNNQRSFEFALDGATTMAIQNVRYSPNPYSSSPVNCLQGPGPVTIGGQTIWVFCTQQQYDPISSVTRVVNFFACRSSTCTAGAALLQAQVTFDDYSVANDYFCTAGGPTSTCGSSMRVNSWVLVRANS